MTLPVTEEHVRTLVREVLRRRLHTGAEDRGRLPLPMVAHASHARLPVTTGQHAGGPCLIEPAVACDECGFCQSLGH